MTGWYAIGRSALDHELLQPEGEFTRFEAWNWMIREANFAPQDVEIAGAMHVIPRGSFCHSLRYTAGKLGWSVKRLRTFLNKLERRGMVEISMKRNGSKRGTAQTQVTLCNYDKYQFAGHSLGTEGAQLGHNNKQGNKETPQTPQGGLRRFGVPSEVKTMLGVANDV